MTEPSSPLQRLIAELKKRRVFRGAAAYLVVGWVVIEVFSEVGPALSLPEWTTTLVVVLVLMGFPLALVVSWTFDLTPEGLRREEGSEGVAEPPAAEPPVGGAPAGEPPRPPGAGRTAPLSPLSRVRGSVIVGAVGLFALGAVTVVLLSIHGSPEVAPVDPESPEALTVAVLPFSYRGSAELAYLGEGMADLLSGELAGHSRLRSVDPHALLGFLDPGGGPSLDPDRGRRVAEHFGAGLYVLGSIFQVGDRLRLTASLYDRSRGARPVARESVEGQVDDALELARRLGAAVSAGAGGDSEVTARVAWSGTWVDILGQVSPDGRHLSFVDWRTGDLALRDLTRGTERRLTDKGPWAESDALALFSVFSPDGRSLAFSWLAHEGPADYHWELRVVSLDGTRQSTLLDGEGSWDFYHPLAWAADGRHVLAMISSEDDKNRDLVRVSADDGDRRTLRRLPPAPSNQAHGTSFSPDRRFVAYTERADERGENWDLRVAPLEGGEPTPVAAHPARDALLGWTPDGSALFFWSDRGGRPGIWAAPMAEGRPAGEPALVRPDVWWVDPLGFSPAGDFYYGIHASERQVHGATLDWETGEVLEGPELLAHPTAVNSRSPAWSPDGARIAYLVEPQRRGPAPRTLAVRSLETGEVRELVPDLAAISDPAWEPGGGSILLAGQDFGQGENAVYRLHLESGRMEEVVASPGDGLRSPLPVPGTGRLLFTVPVGEERSLQLYDPGTREFSEILRSPGWIQFAVAPDGKKVLTFVARADRTGQLRIVPLDGGPSRGVLELPPTDIVRGLAWGPGDRILFLKLIDDPDAQGELQQELWTLNPETGNARKLLDMSGGGWGVAIHPDGRRIAFESGSGQAEVWVLENFAAAVRAALEIGGSGGPD